MFLRLLYLLAALLVCAAQTILTTDANGNPITISIGVTSASATTAAATTTTTPLTTSITTSIPPQPTVQQQGPVGQPAATTGTPGAPIPYVYTTVVNGVTNVVSDIFTPTSPSTIEVVPTGTGTILDFSAYQSIYGTITAPASRPAVHVMYTLSVVVALCATMAF